MVTVESTGSSSSVDRAMNEVLSAEREARDAVERCRAEAVRILAAAEEGARRIAQRTEDRVKLAGRVADQAVERALRELQGTEDGPAAAVSDAEAREPLDRAVHDLVEEILGAER
jgi:vacuolar-type H+-ATPase subunit H